MRPSQTLTDYTETRLNSTSCGRRNHKTTNFSISFSVNLGKVQALEFKSRKRYPYCKKHTVERVRIITIKFERTLIYFIPNINLS